MWKLRAHDGSTNSNEIPWKHAQLPSRHCGVVSSSILVCSIGLTINLPVFCMTSSIRLPMILGTARVMPEVPSSRPMAPTMRARSGRASSTIRRAWPTKALGFCTTQYDYIRTPETERREVGSARKSMGWTLYDMHSRRFCLVSHGYLRLPYVSAWLPPSLSQGS